MTLKTIIPTIALLVVASGLFVVDPMRRAGPGLETAGLASLMGEPPESLGPWRLDGRNDAMPRAFDAFHEAHEQSARYVLDNETAYLRVAVARDRRDLRAYMPAHAMRRSGWSAVTPVPNQGLERCIHIRNVGLLGERISVESAYVLPGRWGHDPRSVDRAPPLGPGWPGPGAVVQLMLTNPDSPADELRQHVRDLAESMAQTLHGADAP